jgi:hypothetical protein
MRTILNDQYRNSLLKDGYVPEDQLGRLPVRTDGSIADEICKLSELRDSGP